MTTSEISIFGRIGLFFLNFKDFFKKAIKLILGWRAVSFIILLILISIVYNVADTIKQEDHKIKYFTIHFAEPVTAADYRNVKYADKIVLLADGFFEKTKKDMILDGFLILGNIMKIIVNTLFYIYFFVAMVAIGYFLGGKTSEKTNLLIPAYIVIPISIFIALLLIAYGNALLKEHYEDQLEPEFAEYLHSSYFIPYQGTLRQFTAIYDIASGKAKKIVQDELPSYDDLAIKDGNLTLS